MIFKETQIFTKRINKLMDDENYRQLQNVLIDKPSTGKLIQGSSGIRKIRWGGSGRGKRGGSRFIYYWATSQNQIYMLFVYTKNECSDLWFDDLKPRI